MEWGYLMIAGLFEVLGVAMITKFNRKRGVLQLILLISAFSLSFLFLSLAMSVLPMAISYAVWTGIGAAGGVVIGMLFYNEPKQWQRLFFLSMIIFASVGLKLVT
ncbi:DMT family transporter [Halalkalibacter flavus]|uniref:DMT family transporter n=1 Tax=Halalkalibacter flavus TaxID=3090668 RepID=UPI002FC8532A